MIKNLVILYLDTKIEYEYMKFYILYKFLLSNRRCIELDTVVVTGLCETDWYLRERLLFI